MQDAQIRETTPPGGEYVAGKTKVYLTTPSFYLMAVLLPTPLAAVAAAIGIWLIQWLMRAKTGNLPSDMATAASRWVIVILLSGSLAHIPASDDWPRIGLLFATAVLMFLGDMLTCPLDIAPMSGEGCIRQLSGAQLGLITRFAACLAGIQILRDFRRLSKRQDRRETETKTA